MASNQNHWHHSPQNPQRFLNGEVHQWYRMVLGYPDHLVASILDHLALKSSSRVLDPFCGSGTTLIECMKRGIPSVGLDANPVSVMAAGVKSDWSLDPVLVRRFASDVSRAASSRIRAGRRDYRSDPTYRYIQSSGMLKRGWISGRPLRKAIALKQAIRSLDSEPKYRDALTLCLLTEVVYEASNVKFGPEIYCSKRKFDVDVVGGFKRRATLMSEDLETLAAAPFQPAGARVLRGDARNCAHDLRRFQAFDACISSPPYPTEHDYTRNTRLELAFLESVTDIESLREIKRNMVRSHSKNVYKSDSDANEVRRYRAIQSLAAQVTAKVVGKRGFVGLYPQVVLHYFGGMKRHFAELREVLRPGAPCAYVVGDQSSYCGVHIPTAEIISLLLRSSGFRNVEVRRWRGRWSTTHSREVSENIVLFTRS